MAVDVDPTSAVETPYTVRNQSFSNGAYRFGNWLHHVAFAGPDDRSIDAVPYVPGHQLLMDSRSAGSVLAGIRVALLLLLAVTGLRAAWSGNRRSCAAVFGLACVASLVISPLSRGHYFVLWLPAVLWVPMIANPRIARLLVWTPLLLTGLHYIALDYAGRVGLLGLGTTAWYLLASWTVLRGAQPVLPVLPVRAASSDNAPLAA
jgi:hypothetical protein